MARLQWSFKNQDAKKVIRFSFFLPFCGEKVSSFSKEVKMLEV